MMMNPSFLSKSQKQMLTNLLIIALFMTTISCGKIQCQYEPSTWVKSPGLLLSERQLLVPTIYGVDVLVDAKDRFVSKIIRDKGYFEPQNLRGLARFVQKGHTIINVGSHIGLEAIVLGKIAGSEGKLFIFEPFSISFNMVLKNIFINKLGDIATVYNVGANDKKTTGKIIVDLDNTGGSQIFTSPKAKTRTATEIVQLDTVDNILPKDTIVDFALIDVQRLDIECLSGMKQTILRSPNIVIMAEWSGYATNMVNYKQQARKLLNWFLDHKFKFFQLNRTKTGNCKPAAINPISLEKVLAIKSSPIQDIFIIPSHIDPNSVS